MNISQKLLHRATAALAPLAAALALAPVAAAASPPPAAPTGPLYDWTASGVPAVDSSGASFTTSTGTGRNFVWQVTRTERGATVAFDVLRSGAPMQLLAAFVNNNVSLDDRPQGVYLRTPAGVVQLSATPMSSGTWHHVELKLDITGGRASATVDGTSVSAVVPLRDESVARVGDIRADSGGPYTFRALAVTLAPAPLLGTPTTAGLFSQESVWNAPLGDNAAIDPASDTLVRSLNTEVNREKAANTGPWIATTGCAPKLYTVPAGQPRVRVILDDPTGPWRRGLAAAFASVPLPDSVTPSNCTDSQLSIHQLSTDTVWEFFHLRRELDGWHAGWGGAMQRVSTNPGYYTPDAFPGATFGWGATATSLPLAAGAIRASELKSGVIKHALAISLPDVRAGVQAWPAMRNDGRLTTTDSLPEGAHLRLRPDLDLDALGLPPATLTIARAVQRYGMIVNDVTHQGIKLDAENWEPLGSNPYPAIFGSVSPIPTMKAFPWSELQVLRMDLRAPVN